VSDRKNHYVICSMALAAFAPVYVDLVEFYAFLAHSEQDSVIAFPETPFAFVFDRDKFLRRVRLSKKNFLYGLLDYYLNRRI
jgi:hypothetical protein